jgi:hypothetical protein
MQDCPNSSEPESRELVILAPFGADVPAVFERKTVSRRHGDLLADVQRLRGLIYSSEGAIDRGHFHPMGATCSRLTTRDGTY